MKIKKRYERIIENWIINGLRGEGKIEKQEYRGYNGYFETYFFIEELGGKYYSILENNFGKSYRYWLNNINIFSLIGTLKIRGLKNKLKREMDNKFKGLKR